MKKLIAIVFVLFMLSGSLGIVAYADDFRYGDSNKDGKLNIKDATHIQRYSAMLIELDEEALRLSDVDGSSQVNVKDATMIQKLLASIIDSFPVDTKPSETVPPVTTTEEPESTAATTVPDETQGTTGEDVTEPAKPTNPSVDEDGYYDQIVRP